MRAFLAIYVLVCVGLVSYLGLPGSKSSRPPLEIFADMERQPRYRPQGENPFFGGRDAAPMGRNDRPVPAGTVPHASDADAAWPDTAPRDAWLDAPGAATGIDAYGAYVTRIPLPVDDALLARGRETFGIHCTACHGAAGDGQGILARYKMAIPSYHSDTLSSMPDGQVFETISMGSKKGTGAMGAYGNKIAIPDRWGVVAYVRSLQQRTQAARPGVAAPAKEAAK